MADGLTFTIQAIGPKALGSSGSGLGYRIDPLDATRTGARILRSVAVAFNLVDITMGIRRDGVKGGSWTHDLSANGIALNRGHELRVDLAYGDDAKSLSISVRDLEPPHPSTGVLTIGVDVPGILKLGSPARAFIGFTAATGAKSAEQTIVDWTVATGLIA